MQIKSLKRGAKVYSFFVLGIIPGINIQINFQGWLNLLGLTLVAGALLWLHRQHHLIADELALERLPLPASQLHQRLQLSVQ